MKCETKGCSKELNPVKMMMCGDGPYICDACIKKKHEEVIQD